MTAEAILFDIGGVFFTAAPEKEHSILLRHGLNESSWALLKASGLYQIYKCGQIDESEFLSRSPEILPPEFRGEVRDFFLEMHCAKQLNEDLVFRLKELQSRFRLAVLSNSNSFLEERLSRFDLLDHFEFVINSHRVRMAKPDPDIFRLALRRVGLSPEKVLFVDDKERNVNAAASLGFQTHVFKDTQGLLAALRFGGP